MNPLAADDRFFKTLVSGDAGALEPLLADDFILIDVMGGAENEKMAFLAFVDSGHVTLTSIQPSERRVRVYGLTAIVTGRTQMQGRFAGAIFTASSRYTHVFVLAAGEWKLATAQGTPISTAPGS